jgi:Fe-Mn family superoxide dismutase
MSFPLPDLPYAFDALEPHIDARTMQIHHDKHHAAYIAKVNAAIEGTDLDGKSIEELVSHLDGVPENIRGAVRNNGGGHANHSLFWTVMGPGAGGDRQRTGWVRGLQKSLYRQGAHAVRQRLGLAEHRLGRQAGGH